MKAEEREPKPIRPRQQFTVSCYSSLTHLSILYCQGSDVSITLQKTVPIALVPPMPLQSTCYHKKHSADPQALLADHGRRLGVGIQRKMNSACTSTIAFYVSNRNRPSGEHLFNQFGHAALAMSMPTSARERNACTLALSPHSRNRLRLCFERLVNERSRVLPLLGIYPPGKRSWLLHGLRTLNGL